MKDTELRKKAVKVRKGALEAIYEAGSGHPGGSLSSADLFTYLYFEEMNVSPELADSGDLSLIHISFILEQFLATGGDFSKILEPVENGIGE